MSFGESLSCCKSLHFWEISTCMKQFTILYSRPIGRYMHDYILYFGDTKCFMFFHFFYEDVDFGHNSFSSSPIRKVAGHQCLLTYIDVRTVQFSRIQNPDSSIQLPGAPSHFSFKVITVEPYMMRLTWRIRHEIWMQVNILHVKLSNILLLNCNGLLLPLITDIFITVAI